MNIRLVQFSKSLWLTVALFLCVNTPTLSQSNSDRVLRNKEGIIVAVHVGRYVNHQYGYSVRIPKGLEATCSPPPMPQHGFTIDLSQKLNNAYVTVFASYGGLGWASLNGAVETKLKSLKDDASFVLVMKQNVRLGDLPAVRLVYKFKDSKSGLEKIGDEVVAYKPAPKDDAPIVYELSLRAPETRYKKDRVIFNQVLRSWRAVRIS